MKDLTVDFESDTSSISSEDLALYNEAALGNYGTIDPNIIHPDELSSESSDEQGSSIVSSDEQGSSIVSSDEQGSSIVSSDTESMDISLDYGLEMKDIIGESDDYKSLNLPVMVSNMSNVKFLDTDHFLYYLEHITNTIYYDTGIVHPMASDYKNMLVMNFQDQKFETSRHLTSILSDTNTRFVIVPIALVFPSITSNYLTTSGSFAESGHANMLVIDNEIEQIEFFEPHGKVFSGDLGKFMDIPELLHRFLGNINDKYNYYSLVNASEMCLYGIQELQNKHESVGHCLAWSMLFLHLRILNPMLSSSHIMQTFMTNFTMLEQSNIIKMYIATIEDYFYENEDEYLSPVSLKFQNTSKSLDTMTNRLGQIVVQYKMLLGTANFEQANYLFEELIMYRNLPMFHQTLLFLKEP